MEEDGQSSKEVVVSKKLKIVLWSIAGVVVLFSAIGIITFMQGKA
ncbi:hypothetical protein SUNDANCE_63 [Brevibacillus phage Sundance]|nr:hypothetical protein AVT09_gp063 [Brevibacillus phage Sundance]ALA47879.1 hypothetical protein SUNDANCE_63 [Brevibacillus phage Sundance]